MTDMIYTHMTARVPGEDGTFLIKEAPLGEVTLIGIDVLVANGSPHPVVVLPGEVAVQVLKLDLNWGKQQLHIF